ncbi:endonuclease/exonuclease/phosphatase family protein [Dactylosporangium sp. CS-047395]|uniref:endonuclease/exonuclease/phosphatase family protein n=1 Tax=Dactylosporangium sp. CS-047395 TaxID=3239936 RepID=UPI003D937E02
MRVLTWNLWWRFGDWRARQDAILAVLRAERPDVCGLQEVWAEPSRNQAAVLAAELDMHWAWSPSPQAHLWQRRTGEHDVGAGNAVLSRWPIGASAIAALPGGDGRTVLHARVDAPAGPVPFFTTHLHSPPAGSAVRVGQVAAMARFVARHTGAEHPAVVTGDCNAEPDSDELRLLGGRLTAPAAEGQVLVDAWRFTSGADPGYTWDARNPHTRAFGLPSSRIDYVLVGLPRGTRGTVKRAYVCGNVPVGGVWPSDHAAVAADLKD